MTDPYSADDYGNLLRLVRSKANRDVLRPEDIEDLAHDILDIALQKRVQLGVPLIAIAVRTAQWVRYYTDANKQAFRTANNHRLGVDSVRNAEQELSSEESDARVVDTRWHSKTDFPTEVALRDLIARLPLPQRMAFTLCGEGGYTHEEAALILEVSPATVGRNLALARQTLQAQVLAL